MAKQQKFSQSDPVLIRQFSKNCSPIQSLSGQNWLLSWSMLISVTYIPFSVGLPLNCDVIISFYRDAIITKIGRSRQNLSMTTVTSLFKKYGRWRWFLHLQLHNLGNKTKFGIWSHRIQVLSFMQMDQDRQCSIWVFNKQLTLVIYNWNVWHAFEGVKKNAETINLQYRFCAQKFW